MAQTRTDEADEALSAARRVATQIGLGPVFHKTIGEQRSDGGWSLRGAFRWIQLGDAASVDGIVEPETLSDRAVPWFEQFEAEIQKEGLNEAETLVLLRCVLRGSRGDLFDAVMIAAVDPYPRRTETDACDC